MQIWRLWTSALQTSSGLVSQLSLPLTSFQLDNEREGINGNAQKIRFTSQWDVIGPFQIGTREAAWGSDPLEHYGGFRSLRRSDDEHNEFGSSLAPNGSVTWSQTTTQPCETAHDQACARLSVSFPDIDWKFLRSTYGWAATQWQGWARGELQLDFKGNQTLLLHTENIVELWIDGEHYFGGDFYGYKRTPIVLHLRDGQSRLQIDVRLIRDVRSMGGSDTPTVDITLTAAYSVDDLVKQPFHVHQPSIHEVLMSDVVFNVSGLLGSPCAAVIVRNDGRDDAYIDRIEADHDDCVIHWTHDLQNSKRRVIPGQSRPLAFRIECASIDKSLKSLEIRVWYRTSISNDARTLTFKAHLRARHMHDRQRITFMHPGGVVSYAMMQPPHQSCPDDQSLPILLALHGAGVEVDDETLQDALDGLPRYCAWTVVPTGGTTWSGDDWHQWGFSDVKAAVDAVGDWIDSVEWHGPKADFDRWFVLGHSNGGQGTWYMLTHFPDQMIAAAALSGYSSIQNYVPYTFWQSSDPSKTAVVQSALKSYDHELLLENAKDVPIYIQHGAQDDNVPPYHSRLLSQRLRQHDIANHYMEYLEGPHWWEGVLSTEPLNAFVHAHINRTINTTIPASDFTMVTAGHGDMGPKNGVEVLDLINPGQFGKLHVRFDPITRMCNVQTSNVQTFSLSPLYHACSLLVIDGKQCITEADGQANIILSQENNDGWVLHALTPPISRRRGPQLGPLDSILRTRGAFQIINSSPSTGHIALQIARNLFQYFAADSEITEDRQAARLKTNTNLITVAVGKDVPSHESGHALGLRFVNGQLELLDQDARIVRYPTDNGLAAIFLRPLPGQRLELLIWGVDIESLEIAARLMPMMTGTGQPDFIVLDKTMLGKGLDGILAMGSFDSFWRISRHSFVG